MRAIPINFARVTDPLGQGFVDSIARSDGNATGLTNFEASMARKSVELVKQIDPGIRGVAVICNSRTTPFAKSFMSSFETAAQQRRESNCRRRV
jgi:putative ABC transport system substrate-binding protein